VIKEGNTKERKGSEWRLKWDCLTKQKEVNFKQLK
jgi:hypothetical protein